MFASKILPFSLLISTALLPAVSRAEHVALPDMSVTTTAGERVP